MKDLSIIIPVYNESKRLYNIETVYKYLNSKKYKPELIIVDDGSEDDTLTLLKKLRKKYPFKIITYPKNRGKGYAIKTGILEATGKYRLFMDVDLSTPIEEYEKFKSFFDKYDVMIGSRKTKLSKLLKRQPILREYLGKGFTFLSKQILGVEVTDFTCGFKIFSKEAAVKIFSKSVIERWGYDSEILFIANKEGFKVKEVPVEWSNDQNTRVKFPQDIINSLQELVSIRVNNFIGKYD